MISIILTATGDAKALARLLTALVPAAAEGLVREVAVVGAAGASAELAEDAGADLYPRDAFERAVERARGPWLAGLPLGPTLAKDWMEILAEHLARGAPRPARLVARKGALEFTGGPEGWLAPKSLVGSAVAAEENLERLARRGGRRLRILDRR